MTSNNIMKKLSTCLACSYRSFNTESQFCLCFCRWGLNFLAVHLTFKTEVKMLEHVLYDLMAFFHNFVSPTWQWAVFMVLNQSRQLLKSKYHSKGRSTQGINTKGSFKHFVSLSSKSLQIKKKSLVPILFL